jgi:glycerol-3-phosphate dehydrogenase
MAAINRDVSGAAASQFDLVIVGAGIYGVMLALEAGLRGRRALLLEKEDFGGATSRNHLRTVHGGFRYLQSLDLPRFFESVSERRWFLRNVPALIQVLPCLMPLYGHGLKRPSIMRAGLLLNDGLSMSRNWGVADDKRLPNGKIVSKKFLQNAFPQIDRKELKAGALWYDAAMPEHQRLLMEILRWACDLGAVALNYVEAQSVLLYKDQVRGIQAVDRQSGQQYEFRAALVINAAGPWCRQLAQAFDRDYPQLFRRRLLLFNILFKRKALSAYALALVPPNRLDHTYFVHNWKNRLLAGTAEILATDENENPEPRPEDIRSFITDMNHAVPELSLAEKDIEHIYAGFLPATASGKLAGREVILDHRQHNGPAGLFSVSGVKYTTAHRVAGKTMNKVFPGSRAERILAPVAAHSGRWFFDYEESPSPSNPKTLQAIKAILAEEAVVHLDDLLLRRSSLGENPRRALEMLPQLRPLFPWNDLRWQQECVRVKSLLTVQL